MEVPEVHVPVGRLNRAFQTLAQPRAWLCEGSARPRGLVRVVRLVNEE